MNHAKSYSATRGMVYHDGFADQNERGPWAEFSLGRQPTSSEVGTTVYSDRMFSWDMPKYNHCCQQVWGNQGQMFYSYERSHADIEKFLRLYFDKPGIVLLAIIRYKNEANGFPVWRFDYLYPR